MRVVSRFLFLACSSAIVSCANVQPLPRSSTSSSATASVHADLANQSPGAESRFAEESGEDGPVAGRQTLNVFVGGTADFRPRERFRGSDEGLEGFVFGLDYEHRLNEDLGVGGFSEAVLGADRSFAGGGQVYWHAVDELIVVAGPGIERRRDEWGLLFRVGVAYEIPLGDGLLMSPGVFYDFAEGEDLLLYGLSFGTTW